MNRIITIGLVLLVAGCQAQSYRADPEERPRPTRYQTLNFDTGELEYWNVYGNRAYNYSTGEYRSIREW